jgi:hypothetical protein
MAGTFSNRKKLILLANAIEQNLDYVKQSDSLFKETEIRGRKYGMAVHGYLPDAGSTHRGLVAVPDKAHQVEVTAWMDNYNTAAEVDMWDRLVNIEDFNKEMVEKRAKKLARDAQKSIIEQNVYLSAQAVVATSVGYDMLSDASAALDELSVTGDRVDYQTPTLLAKIGRTGANLFLPSEIQKGIYEDASIGMYANASHVNMPGMPILDTTGMGTSVTISADVVKDASNNIIGVKPISTATAGSGTLFAGLAYKVNGLKVVDEGGVETNQDYVIIVNKERVYDSEGTPSDVTYIPQIRITASGKGYGNPNAHMSASAIGSATTGSTVTLSLTPLLTASKHYQVGQLRNAKALSFDAQKFDDLPAAKQENVGAGEFITLKMQSAPVILNGVEYFRIDLPYVSKIFEPRQSVTTYLLLD